MELFNGMYKISVETLNVIISVKTDTLKKVKGENDELVETDEYVYNNIGYFSSMESALKLFYGYLLKQKSKKLQKKAVDIKELLVAIKESKDEIIEEFHKINLKKYWQI